MFSAKSMNKNAKAWRDCMTIDKKRFFKKLFVNSTKKYLCKKYKIKGETINKIAEKITNCLKLDKKISAEMSMKIAKSPEILSIKSALIIFLYP